MHRAWRRSPTGSTTSPASAARCCARWPASTPSARGGPPPGDLGLQFLEWWAYLADVLTFYNERIANETYLRTAQFPESIAGLVALLGYAPRPGTGRHWAGRPQSAPPPTRPSRW